MSQNKTPRRRNRGATGRDARIPGQKPKNFKITFMRLLYYMKPRRKRIYFVFIAAILSTVFMILGPKIMGNTITVVFEGAYAKLTGSGTGIDFTQVGQLLLFLAGLYAFNSLFNFEIGRAHV